MVLGLVPLQAYAAILVVRAQNRAVKCGEEHVPDGAVRDTISAPSCLRFSISATRSQDMSLSATRFGATSLMRQLQLPYSVALL